MPAPNVNACCDHRTREQCQGGLLRFHPEVSVAAVHEMLRAHGFYIEAAGDGIQWIRHRPTDQIHAALQRS